MPDCTEDNSTKVGKDLNVSMSQAQLLSELK
jgi:hypothetical protein